MFAPHLNGGQQRQQQILRLQHNVYHLFSLVVPIQESGLVHVMRRWGKVILADFEFDKSFRENKKLPVQIGSFIVYSV